MTLELGAVGWDHDRWRGQFYPEDLPREWRLTYYANEHRTVLVPETYWLGGNMPKFRQWYDDVPEEFRFYFYLTSALTQSSKGLDITQSIQSLKEKLGGLIVDTYHCPGDPVFAQIRAWCPEAKLYGLSELVEPGVLKCWQDFSGLAPGYIGLAHFDGQPDLKPLRKLIEEFSRASARGDGILFIDGEFSILHNATIIARLSGV